MLPVEDEYLETVNGPHLGSVWSASASYGAVQTVADVPLTPDGSFTTDSTGNIQTTGKVYVAKQDDTSLVPHGPSDPLAPVGQELAPVFTVRASGGKSWSFGMGRFRIAGVPSMKEYFRRWPDRKDVIGWECQLDLVDRFDILDADDFHTTTAPLPSATVLSELQRLCTLPLVIPAFVTDVPVPAGTTYSSRIDAMKALAGVVGCKPALTRQGAFTLRLQNRWLTETTPDFELNGVIDMDDSMSLSIFNSVTVSCPSDENILGIAELTDANAPGSPFRVTAPIGRRTYSASNPLMDTQAKADAAAATMLARLSSPQSREVTVTCPLMPHIEVGDFGKVTDPIADRTVMGEVTGLTWQMDVTQPMQMKMMVAGVV